MYVSVPLAIWYKGCVWTYLIAGLTYGFAAGVQPGPLNAYLVSVTVRHGFRRALPAAFAPLLSDAFVIALTLSILTRVPYELIRWLHLLGGIFVLYLAWDAWKSSRDIEAFAKAELKPIESVWKAAVVNLLNPNPYLGWSLVLGPFLLQAWRTAHRDAIALVIAFYTALVGTTLLIVWLFDFARIAGPRVARVLVMVSSVVLAGFGLYQLWLGTTGK